MMHMADVALHLSGSVSHSATSSGESIMYFCSTGRWHISGKGTQGARTCTGKTKAKTAGHAFHEPKRSTTGKLHSDLHNRLHQLRAL